ncbi:MAG: hypothetical protein V1784_12865 [bacterium]
MIAWYWMLGAFFGGLLMGWMICSLMVVSKESNAEKPLWGASVMETQNFFDNLYHWFSAMDEPEMSKILYSLVKNVYFGRRTIHKCPTRKGKTINLLDTNTNRVVRRASQKMLDQINRKGE